MTNRQPDRAPAALTLDAFLLARIAEDEAIARGFTGPRWVMAHDLPDAWGGLVEHVMRFRPARVLAECEAKRGAIEAAWSDHGRIEGEWGMGKSREQMSAEDDNPAVLEWLALPYAEHPDYREEWKP